MSTFRTRCTTLRQNCLLCLFSNYLSSYIYTEALLLLLLFRVVINVEVGEFDGETAADTWHMVCQNHIMQCSDGLLSLSERKSHFVSCILLPRISDPPITSGKTAVFVRLRESLARVATTINDKTHVLIEQCRRFGEIRSRSCCTIDL